MHSFELVSRLSSRGRSYATLREIMPRIPDPYLDCVFYLYNSEQDAFDGTRAGGCGFLVGIPSKGLKRNFWFLYAVTNRHLVDSANYIRLNTPDGRFDVLPTIRSEWMTHPAGDDLAACLISFDPKDFIFDHVPRDVLLSKAITQKMRIGPGDETFTIGRFMSHEGKQRNLPTARFGNVAQMPSEAVKQDDSGFMQESFLVEMRSISGFSGAPVFVHIPMFSARPGMDGWTPTNIFDPGPFGCLASHGPWLLGINWGHLHTPETVKDLQGRPHDPVMQVNANTGMGLVVPAWKLAELLDEGPLADARHRIIQEVLDNEQHDPSVATMD